jgi:hypothetical protein
MAVDEFASELNDCLSVDKKVISVLNDCLSVDELAREEKRKVLRNGGKKLTHLHGGGDGGGGGRRGPWTMTMVHDG